MAAILRASSALRGCGVDRCACPLSCSVRPCPPIHRFGASPGTAPIRFPEPVPVPRPSSGAPALPRPDGPDVRPDSRSGSALGRPGPAQRRGGGGDAGGPSPPWPLSAPPPDRRHPSWVVVPGPGARPDGAGTCRSAPPRSTRHWLAADRRSGSKRRAGPAPVPRHPAGERRCSSWSRSSPPRSRPSSRFAGPQLVTQTRQLGRPAAHRRLAARHPRARSAPGRLGCQSGITEFVASLLAKIGEQDADLGRRTQRASGSAWAPSCWARCSPSALLDGPVWSKRSARHRLASGDRADIGRIVDR